MRRFWLLILSVLTACSDYERADDSTHAVSQKNSRNPSAISISCNRQTLGTVSPENDPLVKYNSKRADAIQQLLQTQISKLRTKSPEDASVKMRLSNLESRSQSLSSSEFKPWAEPNEVSWKLRQALTAYLDDMSTDEKSSSLSEQEVKKLKYVRESLEPNLTQVDFWLPEFCEKNGGHRATDFFKGL